MWDLIVSVPDHCLSFYFVSEAEFDTKTWQGYLKKKSLYAWHVAAN